MNKIQVTRNIGLAYQWIIPREISDNANMPVLIFFSVVSQKVCI